MKSPWYLKVSAGPAFTADQKIKSIKSTTGSRIGYNGDISYDTGYRVGLTEGYTINEWVSLEGEGAYIYNSINGGGNLQQAPLLGNVVLHYTNAFQKLTPYVGAGGGGLFSAYQDVNIQANGTGAFRSVDGFYVQPAYQVFGGVKWSFTNWFDVNLAYKYLATVGEFEPWGGMSKGSTAVELESIAVHTLELGAAFRF